MLDEVVVTYFQAPKSYTAEDVVEIACHGGHFVAESILDVLIRQGARLSEPGEFTKRAFLNGRLDLSQAEAVADLIHARTRSSHQLALQQLQGRVKDQAARIRQRLIDTVSLLELELDFSEDEITQTPYSDIRDTLTDIKRQCQAMLTSFRKGKLFRNGILVPLVGRPNAGKSSILNALLQEERALVSDIPGTTRDTLEESISNQGIEIRLVDTAGLRDAAGDSIESMGIDRAQQVINRADVLLYIIDVTEPVTAPFRSNGTPVIHVHNKIDLVQRPPEGGSPADPAHRHVYSSATELIGIDAIGNAIVEAALGNQPSPESTDTLTITNQRHRDALAEALKSLDKALESVQRELSSEFIVVDLRAAMDSLGLITGETTTDDILNNIFSKFCIGK